MPTVSSVALKYAVRGADKAQRKDKQVRQSIRRTGKQARKEASSVRKWMQRHKAAIAGIAAATAGALMAILKHSPTLRGELAGARLAFSLFAMTVGEDVAPALGGISDTLLDIVEAYEDLDPAVRKPISALIAFGLAVAFAAATLALLEGLFAGTAIASAATGLGSALYGAAGGAWAAAASFLGLSSAMLAIYLVVVTVVFALGLIASELLGVTDVTGLAIDSQNELINAFLNLIFVLAGPLIGILGTLYAFWIGGWDNAKRVGLRFVSEIWKAFMRLGAFLAKHMMATGITIWTAFEVMYGIVRSLSLSFLKWMLTKVQDGTNSLLEIFTHFRHRVPALFISMWDLVKEQSAQALNDILGKAQSTINGMIQAANKVPGVSIGTVSFGSVDFESANVEQTMQRAAEKARSEFESQKFDFAEMIDPTDIGKIRKEGRLRRRDRLRELGDRVEAMRRRNAPEEVRMAPEGSERDLVQRLQNMVSGVGPDAGEGLPERRARTTVGERRGAMARDRRFRQGPATGRDRPAEDKSVTIERFEVVQQSTGDEELDGDLVGEVAMDYIKEQQQKRE